MRGKIAREARWRAGGVFVCGARVTLWQGEFVFCYLCVCCVVECGGVVCVLWCCVERC